MKQICEELDIKQVFSPVYTPQSNGRLEGWHRFFKACIAKHIRGADVEWDDLIPLAVSAYNFFPCQSSKESPFVLMFGRDPITPIAKLLEPKLKFYGEKGEGLNMSSLRKLYTVVAENIRKARKKQPRQETPPTKLKVNDLVSVKDPESVAFDPKYMPNYRVTAVYGRNRIEVQDEKGNKSMRRAAHVKICEPVNKVIAQLPAQSVYKQYGRTSKLLIHPKDVPNIPLELFDGRPDMADSDKSEDRSTSSMEVNEQLDVNQDLTDARSRTINAVTVIDALDESKNRLQHGSHTETVNETVEVNMLTEAVVQEIDSGDESKSRLNIKTIEADDITTKTGIAVLQIQTDDDSNDASQDRKLRPKTGGLSKNSTSQEDSCFMLECQEAHQPFTPVQELKHIDTTVVNKHNIDKCCVINKHISVEQDSILVPNKWLSGTFSKIAFSVWGKSKTGEESRENVHDKSKLSITPEFDFSL